MTTFKNKTPTFIPGTVAPALPVAQFTVQARIQPAQGGFIVRPVVTAQAADGSNVNPPAGFALPPDVAKAYADACNAAVDACASTLTAWLKTYGYAP